jgi:hypothetical protein
VATVPAELMDTIGALAGEPGRRWIVSLPRLIEALRWLTRGLRQRLDALIDAAELDPPSCRCGQADAATALRGTQATTVGRRRVRRAWDTAAATVIASTWWRTGGAPSTPWGS